MGTNKQNFTLKITPEVLALVEQHYKPNGCTSRSAFIEKAIEFYCGYLAADSNREYISNATVSVMQGTLDSFENRMANLLFKNAVELSMILHTTAAMNEIDESTLDDLRQMCMRDVERTGTTLTLAEAVKFQKG